MGFDPERLPWPSTRFPVFAARGAVATSQHLAAEAGLAVLRAGGNAVDAAVATAITLTVVEPCSNGIGGDAFAIVHAGGRCHGLNSSGPAPAAADPDALRARGLSAIPPLSWEAVTVPGAPAAWEALSRRFGSLPFARLFEDAIAYAREGFPASTLVASAWARAAKRYGTERARPGFGSWFETFAPEGRTPLPGERVRLAGHAESLGVLARGGAAEFYRGRLAGRIEAFARETGGGLRASDLAAFEPEWVEPLSRSFAGSEVLELPPNGQGVVALLALAIREALAGSALERSVRARDGSTEHLSIEAVKAAFGALAPRLGDPRFGAPAGEELLEPAAVEALAAGIGEEASEGRAKPGSGGTVYLAAVDAGGMMVSYIQSNYMGFGSGLVVPGTGIALHNRGAGFSLEPGHPNALLPGKRPWHTIIPGFRLEGGRAVGPFGVMGGYMQPQGQLQVLERRLVEGHNPQAALDAPRWQWTGGRRVGFEQAWPATTIARLRARGHEAYLSLDPGEFGRGQMIERLPDGSYCAGCEGRADSAVAAW